MTKKRLSNFEFLRVISMFMIVLGHISLMSQFKFPSTQFARNVAIQSLWIGGELGVWCFMLISSYFLSKSKFKLKNLGKIWGLTIFYSITIFLILLVTHSIHLSLRLTVQSLLPILSGSYWFVSAYIVVYVFFPYLNIIVEKLDFKKFTQFLILFTIVLTIFPILLKNYVFRGDNPAGGTALDLVYIYFFGAYFRKFDKVFNKKLMKYYIFFFVISIFIMLLSIIFIDWGSILLSLHRNRIRFSIFLVVNSPFQMIAGCSLFLIFKNINFTYSKFINGVASTTFAIYLIHTQPYFAQFWLTKLMNAPRFENSHFIVLIELSFALITFFCCSLIEAIRKYVSSAVKPYFSNFVLKKIAVNFKDWNLK